MCEVTTIALIASAASTAMSMKAASDQADYSSQVARNNAKTSEYAAADAQRRGDLDAQAAQRRVSQMVGAQRAGYAAKGLDITEGTPGDVIDQTNFFGQTDVNTARYNGRLNAWGQQVQAQNFNSSASAAQANGQNAMAGSLLSGAASVADKWYTYSNKPAAPAAGKMEWYE